MLRINSWMLVVLLTVSMICAGCGGNRSPRQHCEQAGGFSYDPPSGWQVGEFPGLKYRISHGPRENEFAANINVVDEAFGGTLAAYVDVNLQTMKEVFVKMQVLSREDFKTQDSEAAVKILTENEQQGRMLRQTFFFVGSGNKKYVVTCTALADGGEKFDTAFSESMKTFRIH
jgi:hypothetical protein